MTRAHSIASCIFGLLCSASIGVAAKAASLTGTWSTKADVCDKVFVRKGTDVTFAQDAFLYGSGFIAEDNQLRGPTATCRIKVRKTDGPVTHLIAACATDIMLSDIQFSIKSIGPDEIVRLFPSMPELSITYYRCSI